MNRFKEETEYDATHIPMFQKVVDMFEGSPDFQRIVKLGLLANMNYSDDLDEVDYNYDRWVHGHSSTGYRRHSDRSSDRELHGNHTRSSSSVYQLPLHYYSAGFGRPCPPFIKVQAKESDTEWRARLLQEAKKKEEKAEKKRLKKQKQKERKRCEKLEKEKLSPVKSEEESGDAPQNSKKVNDESKSSVKDLASAKDAVSSSSEDESSDEDGNTRNDMDDCEELDMSSLFVSKAAFIAKRKLEQKQKKTSPVKEEPKAVPDKPNEDPETEKKDSAATSNPTLEDNVQKSTNLASIGNKYADAGDFYMAVQYFTDAIKFNPTEVRLFGNRSFCFEKMQEYEKALTDAELSLSMCPTFVKGLFRKGRALAGLKRYDEAAQAFREVLKLDSSCAEAAQELMRVQTTQLMEYGLTREQSSNALIIHGTVQKAVEVLFKVNQPGATQNGTVPLAQVANVSGVSPVLSAHINPAFPQPQDAPNSALKYKPVGAVQTMSNGDSQPKPSPHQAMKTTSENIGSPQELYPVWVGNLVNPVTEASLTNLFNKVGVVHSAKLLMFKRCAFVNFTKQEYCEEAIRHFHGFELNGNRIAVRYPDRIPHGMGISKSALVADDFDNVGRNAVGSRGPARPYKHVPDYRDGRWY